MIDIEKNDDLSSLCKRVSESGERVIVHRQGKGAAIISVEDLELLEDLEDRLDIVLAREAMKESGEISWDEIKRKYRFAE